MKILLLNQPDTAIKLLTEIAKKTQDRNLTCDMEPKNIISTIKLFHREENDLEALRDPGMILDHFHYTFIGLGEYDTMLQISHHSNLHVTCTRTKHTNLCIALFSGALREWRRSIIRLSSNDVGADVRQFANDAWTIFDSIGLNHIFSEFRRKGLVDTTFLLERK